MPHPKKGLGYPPHIIITSKKYCDRMSAFFFDFFYSIIVIHLKWH